MSRCIEHPVLQSADLADETTTTAVFHHDNQFGADWDGFPKCIGTFRHVYLGNKSTKYVDVNAGLQAHLYTTYFFYIVDALTFRDSEIIYKSLFLLNNKENTKKVCVCVCVFW